MRTTDNLGIDAALAEYGALRGEIVSRSGAQHVILNISIVATGAVAGLALSDPSKRILALVLPFACTVLGAVWLDHARCIVNIGTYIRISRWPQLRDLSGSPALTSYEDWAHEDRGNFWRSALFAFPAMLTFVAPAVAGLLLTAPVVEGGGLWVLWSLGLAMTAFAAVYWTVFVRNNSAWMYVGPAYRLGESSPSARLPVPRSQHAEGGQLEEQGAQRTTPDGNCCQR